MGALALTYKQQYKTPFSPMIGGAKMVQWLDFEAVTQAVEKVQYLQHALKVFQLWRSFTALEPGLASNLNVLFCTAARPL